MFTASEINLRGNNPQPVVKLYHTSQSLPQKPQSAKLLVATLFYFLVKISTMQETASLPELLKELREIKQRIEHIEELIEDFIDSTLTPEEEEMLKEVEEKIAKGDFSDFIPLEKLDESLRE